MFFIVMRPPVMKKWFPWNRIPAMDHDPSRVEHDKEARLTCVDAKAQRITIHQIGSPGYADIHSHWIRFWLAFQGPGAGSHVSFRQVLLIIA
jgi:hypothetical protein